MELVKHTPGIIVSRCKDFVDDHGMTLNMKSELKIEVKKPCLQQRMPCSQDN